MVDGHGDAIIRVTEAPGGDCVLPDSEDICIRIMSESVGAICELQVVCISACLELDP